MPRINPIDPNTAAGAAAMHLDSTRRMFGGTPNLFTTAANSPAAVGAMVSFFGSLAKGAFTAKVGEQIALAVAQDNGCGYCLSAHTAIGGMLGLGPDALAAARLAQSSDARTEALLRLAVSINDARGHVHDRVLDEARAAGLTDADIVEVVAHVALNVFTNYLNNVAQTTIDFPVVELAAA